MDIRTKFAESNRLLAMQIWQKSLVVPCSTEKGRQPIPDRPEMFPVRPAKFAVR
jgi:hypothetical protein